MRAAFEGDVRPAVIKRTGVTQKSIHKEALNAVRFGRADLFTFFSCRLCRAGGYFPNFKACLPACLRLSAPLRFWQ